MSDYPWTDKEAMARQEAQAAEAMQAIADNPRTHPAHRAALAQEEAPAPPSNGFLSRESILAADDIQFEEVDCKEWGGKVLVRSLDGRQRADWQQASIQGNGKNQTVNFRQTTIKLVALGVVDPTTKRPLFGNADIAALSQKNSAPLERIAEVVMRLSGIGDEEMETLTKNSEETPSDD